MIGKHWNRLKRSLSRRFREWRLPNGFERLGTRYGGWWIDTRRIGEKPLMIDCGLGLDISFPVAFLKRFPDARVIGVEPNPRALRYCRANCPQGMTILDRAIWTSNDQTVTFHLPRPLSQLPKGADGISGSLDPSHGYVAGGERIQTTTVDLASLLAHSRSEECDILKLDVEGSEYALLRALCASGEIQRANQILVEFHHGVTQQSLDETNDLVDTLIANEFSLMHTEGRNYVFLRNNN
jgi:FkbM family methyltransferase